VELFSAADDPDFLAEIRDATNGGFALVGDRLRSTLPADQRPRLARRPPGPQAKANQEPDGRQADLILES
jgi:hypothetical protein